jgi:hypothetical protein
MAKESGLGAQMYLDQYDLSNDTNALGKISKSSNLLEMTGIDKLAIERKAGQLTGQITATTFWNPSNAHTAYSNLPRTDRIFSYFHRATLGAPVASIVGKQVGYNPTREDTGMFTAEVDAQSNAWWLDWGYALTAGKRTDTVATSPATGVDFQIQGMPAAFGLQAYLHVFSFTGTSATITIQDSADNAAFAAIGAGVAFTSVTAATKERIQSGRTQAVRRYLRVITTGTFSNLVFAVQATTNITDMTI